MGNGTNTNSNQPISVRDADNSWLQLVSGNFHSVALRSDGTLWSWGQNSSGQLGLGHTNKQSSRQQIGTDNDWIAVSCGGLFTLALKADGTVWGWGSNARGQLNDTNRANKLSPVRLDPNKHWASIAAGGEHTLLLSSNGELWACGNNLYAMLGNGVFSINAQLAGTADVPALAKITVNLHSVMAIAIKASQRNSTLLSANGKIFMAGCNEQGDLGMGSATNDPRQLGALRPWSWEQFIDQPTTFLWCNTGPYSFVEIGRSAGLTANGNLWLWGRPAYWSGMGRNPHYYWQPNPMTDGPYYPAPASTTNRFIAISDDKNIDRNMYLEADGTCWKQSRQTAVALNNAESWVAMSSAENFNTGLKAGRDIYCSIGNNVFGQLGLGDTINRSSFSCSGSLIPPPPPQAPLQLVAARSGQQVDLEWFSANDQGAELYTVQRTTDFNHIEAVQELNRYAYAGAYNSQDADPYSGTTYYRVKRVSPDAEVQYSDWKKVPGPAWQAVPEASIYPNPSQGNFTVKGRFSADAEIEVLNVLGQVVMESRPLFDHMQMDISSLKNGIYFVRISSGGKANTLRVVLER